MKVYFISGLGADERIFQRLALPAGFDMVHLSWIKEFPDESLSAYSQRMAADIDTTEPFMLAGLSFGGIVAAEISKIHRPVLLILFSSVTTKYELPLLYRLAGNMSLSPLVPLRFMAHLMPFFCWFFGADSQQSRALLQSFIRRSDRYHLRWAIARISRWDNTETILPVLHLHGEKDRVFPASNIRNAQLIKGAGHLCVFTHAVQVNALLRECLQPYS